LQAWATILMSDGNPVYKLVSSWGEKGKGPGKFIDPHSICFGRDGNLIIVDSIPGYVYRYTKEGKYLGEVGSGPGHGAGQFDGPRDAQVDADGNIFVADGNNGRIQVFDPSGKFLRAFGEKGKAPGQMLRVHAIWFGTEGRLYAADVDNSRIMVFSHAGKFLFEWGHDGRGPGEFHAPHGLGGDTNGDLFVSNYWGPCQKFTGDGRFLLEFAPASQTGGPTHWHSMTSDRWGDAYLMSRDKDNRNSIVKYNNNGSLVTSWPPLRSVSEWGVKAAAVDCDGTIYVAVESKARVGIEIYREE
jgi:DNA-binding beta-propeller fold protein YncE